jgi:hypothetical protein
MQIENFDVFFRDALDYACDKSPYAEALYKTLKGSTRLIAAEYNSAYSGALKGYMEDKSGDLDRHKSASALMVAVLRKLKTESLEKNPAISKLIREKIAIQIGMDTLMTMIKKEGGKKNADIIKFWNNNNNTMYFPDVLCDSGKYAESWAIGLYYARQRHPQHGDKLFVPSLANELFLIESYNRLLLRVDG